MMMVSGYSLAWSFTWIDYLFVVIVLASMAIGLFRGFLREIVSIATWVAAIALAVTCSEQVAHALRDAIQTPSLRMLTSLFVLLVSGLMAGALINWALSKLLEKGGLTHIDRSLGVVFGIARGLLLLSLLMLALEKAPLQRDEWWQASKLIPMVEPMARQIEAVLPEFFHNITQKMLGQSDSLVDRAQHQAQQAGHVVSDQFQKAMSS